MEKLKERISYIEGLADGMDLYQNKKEGKFYSELIGLLQELSQALNHTTNRLTELEEYVEAIDEDLNDLEWDYYEEDNYIEDVIEDDDLLDDDEYIEEFVDYNDEEDDIDYLEAECPSCHELVMVDSSLLGGHDVAEVECPHCQELLILESDEDDEELTEEIVIS